VVLPLCYEGAVSYGTGCREGGVALLEASGQMECLDEQTLRPWVDLAIFTQAPRYPGGSPREAAAEMESAADAVLSAGKRLLSLGGDHAVSIGPIAAAARRFPGLTVVQVDAHLDLRETWNGSRFNHACVMRRASADLGLAILPIGIRSVAPEERDYLAANAIAPVFAHEMAGPDGRWRERVRDRLPETVYLTIDVDGLDPSVMPGTGTPEPGGLDYRQLLSLIQLLGSHTRVVAADIVELVKIPGNQVSEYTAARIAQKIITYCWSDGT
jgi:agmatinase